MKREGTSDKMSAGHIQMKKRRIAMYSKEDIAYWMDVFERANRAPVSEKEWCTKVYRKRGVIPWPQKGKGFGQKGMEMLLEMI